MERVVRQDDPVRFTQAPERLRGEVAGGDGGDEESVPSGPVEDNELRTVLAGEDRRLLERVLDEGLGDEVHVPDTVGEIGEVVLVLGRVVTAGPGIGQFTGEDIGERDKASEVVVVHVFLE